MRKDTSAEAALHIALLLATAPRGTGLPASALATFYALSAGSVSKLLQRLVAAGLVEGSSGRSGGYRLSRPASQISALDIVLAIDGVEPEFHCREIRRNGVCAEIKARFSPRCSIAQVMDDALTAWRRSLAGISVADMARQATKTVDPKLQARTASWTSDNAR